MDRIDDAGSDRGATAYELADLFCTQARLRAEELFGQLWNNSDAADADSARRILNGSYSWVEDGVLDPSIPGPWIAHVEVGPSTAENVHRTIG
jgi:hypothetical protein